jgi:hypothetical protein
MCGLDLYSPEMVQLRKGRIGREDSVGGNEGKESDAAWRRRRKP